MDSETDALEGERGGAEAAAGVRPRRWSAVVAKVVGVGLVAVFAVIGVAATGYVAWNGFPPGEDKQAAECTDDRQAAKSFEQQVMKVKDLQPPAAQYQARLWAQVVTAAPDCFSPGSVAMAREFLARR